jgi:hypothetical protein
MGMLTPATARRAQNFFLKLFQKNPQVIFHLTAVDFPAHHRSSCHSSRSVTAFKTKRMTISMQRQWIFPPTISTETMRRGRSQSF